MIVLVEDNRLPAIARQLPGLVDHLRDARRILDTIAMQQNEVDHVHQRIRRHSSPIQAGADEQPARRRPDLAFRSLLQSLDEPYCSSGGFDDVVLESSVVGFVGHLDQHVRISLVDEPVRGRVGRTHNGLLVVHPSLR